MIHIKTMVKRINKSTRTRTRRTQRNPKQVGGV